MQLILALLCLSIGIGALAAAVRDPRIDRSFVMRSLFAIVLFLCYGGAGAAALYLLAPAMEGGGAGAAVIYLVSWYVAGVLLLVDRAPRLAPYPERTRQKVRWAIWLLVAVAACCFLWLTASST
jgi:hypothetical protein